MRALWLVNQLWFIVPVNQWKIRASSELLYKSNLDNKFLWFIGWSATWDVGRTLEEFEITLLRLVIRVASVLPTSRVV